MTTPSSAKIPRRSRRCEAAIKKNDNDSEKKENSQVELTYDVLTIIFKYLNAKDLRNAAIVCRCWREISENEQTLRCSPFTVVENVYESWKDLCPAGGNLMDRLMIRPMLSIAFTRCLTASYRHPAMEENSKDCPCKILPKNCIHVTVGNYGVVKDQTEYEDERKTTLTFLPWDKEVSVEEFYKVRPHYVNAGRTRCGFGDDLNSVKNCYQRLKALTSTRKGYKCFILFTNEQYDDPATIVNGLPRHRHLTLSGGVAHELRMCRRSLKDGFCTKRVRWFGLLISGPGLLCWTAVLRRTCDTRIKVEERLVELRKKVKFKKHTIGFMFACQGRGESMFHDHHVESSIFKKIFPEVPLIGCAGGGEFGTDSIIETMTNRIHQYSTVFLILTYGK